MKKFIKKRTVMSKLLIAMVLALAVFLSGCNNGGTVTTTSGGDASTAATIPDGGERTVTITDMSGDEVTITGEVTEIINLWPAGTSSFFAMGAGDLLSGMANQGSVNEWVKFLYPNAVNIPGLGGTSPTVEDIVKINPDLVIIHPSTAASGFAKQIRDVGIPAIDINFSDYETMEQAYTILGEILGGEWQQKLTDWCTETRARIEKIRNLTASLTDEQRPVVYYIAGQSESLTVTMAADSIFSDWAESAGGIFASRRLELTGTEITPEAVFALNPDAIIIGGVWQHVLKDQLLNTPGWQDLKAVTDERVYTNPYACFNWDRFGLESQLQIYYAFMCISPEIAAENGIDREFMIDDTMAFYKKYTNVELTREQATFMLDGLTPDGTAENAVAPR